MTQHAQIAERKCCRPHARPFRLRFARGTTGDARSADLFVQVPDPVGSGFVASLARPGGSITGFAPGKLILASGGSIYALSASRDAALPHDLRR